MSELVNVVVYGSGGRMGQAVVRSILESKQARLSCALVRPGSGLADEPLDRVFGTLPRDVDFATSLDPDVPCEVLVDFSGPVAFDAALALAIERRAAIIVRSDVDIKNENVFAENVIKLLRDVASKIRMAAIGYFLGRSAQRAVNQFVRVSGAVRTKRYLCLEGAIRHETNREGT